MSNSCVWVDGVADAITDKYLARQFSKFGNVVSCDINRARGSALVAFETVRTGLTIEADGNLPGRGVVLSLEYHPAWGVSGNGGRLFP